MKIIFSARTDTGKVRKENQDSYGISEEKNLYFVCDGMGGGAAGDFASRYAAEIVLNTFEKVSKDEVAQVAVKASSQLQPELARMVAAIRLANRALSNLASAYPPLTGMGTTFTGVQFDTARNVINIFHVGDSRAYRLRNEVLDLLTKDHSKVNELIDQGKMKQEEVKTAEIQSMITRALGTAQKVKIDYKPEHVADEDYFMLCTDGLNGEIDDNKIKQYMIMNRSNLDVMALSLINSANQAGGRDNTTVIAIKAYEEKKGEAVPAPDVSGKVTTFEEETAEETKAEDRILKKLMSEAKIKIPKSAKERSILANPLVLGAAIALLVAVFGLMMPKCGKERTYDTHLSDLAGKVTGISLDVREPIPEQYKAFKRSEDTVAKLQIIQDWYKDSKANTLPLKEVAVVVSGGNKEQFKGITGESRLEIKLEKGTYVIRFNKQGYNFVNERMEIKEGLSMSIEPSSSYTSLTIVMIPQ